MTTHCRDEADYAALYAESEFQSFPKMGRLSRDCVITEKIDGTNAQICITQLGLFLVGSRNRWLTPANDNFGFARWADEHKAELMTLGPGRHFGEWWGAGIQRGYGLKEKRFSLFNTERWVDIRTHPWNSPFESDKQEFAPACCHVVPVLYRGPFRTSNITHVLGCLEADGSRAAPGFMDPEGIIIWHTAARVSFKKTIKDDEKPKGAQ